MLASRYDTPIIKVHKITRNNYRRYKYFKERKQWKNVKIFRGRRETENFWDSQSHFLLLLCLIKEKPWGNPSAFYVCDSFQI